jgi:phosphoheptose isomerase
LSEQLLACAETILAAFQRGNKVLICGNGGSAADAQHFAGELVGRFRLPNRPALPAISLNADTAVLTAWANDTSFDRVFSRQVEAYGQPGDVLIGISTSGNSLNLIEAFHIAGNLGVTRMALLGGDGGALLPLSDFALIVPSTDPQRIQEVQIFIIHMLCELIEQQIAMPDKGKPPALARSNGGWLSPVRAGVSVAYEKSE